MSESSGPEGSYETEEHIFKRKCSDLKSRILEVEGNNEVATLALSRTKAAIRRLRLEYVILLERLEERAIHIPNGINAFEEMASPPMASVLDEASGTSVSKISRNGISKKNSRKPKHSPLAALANGNSGLKTQKIRDPDLPKRPTNAYLIFCDLEKDRIKLEIEEKNPGASNDLSKSMTEAWKNLGDADRKPYYKLYEDDRIRYQTEMLAYNQKRQFITDNTEGKRKYKRQKSDSEGNDGTEDDLRSEGNNDHDGHSDNEGDQTLSNTDGLSLVKEEVEDLELDDDREEDNEKDDDEHVQDESSTKRQEGPTAPEGSDQLGPGDSINDGVKVENSDDISQAQ